MGCSSGLPMIRELNSSTQILTGGHVNSNSSTSTVNNSITGYKPISFNLFNNKFSSDSAESEFILTGWTSLVSRIQLLERLPNCSIAETVRKIEAAEDLKSDETMNDVFQELRKAQSKSSVIYFLYAYTMESSFYITLNRKLSKLSASDNFADLLSAILLKPNNDKNNQTEDWSLCFTSVILKAVTSSNSTLKSFTGRTYRGLTMTQHQLSSYQTNTLLVQKAFSSSSKLRSVAEKFAAQYENGKICALITFIMDTNNTVCIDLAQLSNYPGEQEVLILPFSVFVITNVARNSKDNLVEIEMKIFSSDGSIGSNIPSIFNLATPTNLLKSALDSLTNLNMIAPTANMLDGYRSNKKLDSTVDEDENEYNDENRTSEDEDNRSEDERSEDERSENQTSVEETETNESDNEKEDKNNTSDEEQYDS